MISMEFSMNLVDYLVTGGAKITFSVLPLMLIAGFLTPWPYNYWRLKKYGVGCCGKLRSAVIILVIAFSRLDLNLSIKFLK